MMIYEKTSDFFAQKMHMTTIHESRLDFLDNLCKNKAVLHIGCADAGTFGVDHNLHIRLSRATDKLVGMDTDKEATNSLKQLCPGTYVNSFAECAPSYDIIIAPEVLEHVWNVGDFLDHMFAIKAKEYLISVPNILHYSQHMVEEDTYATEIVNPDHKCWFSPYTLYAATKPYIQERDLCVMYYLDYKSIVSIHITRP